MQTAFNWRHSRKRSKFQPKLLSIYDFRWLIRKQIIYELIIKWKVKLVKLFVATNHVIYRNVHQFDWANQAKKQFADSEWIFGINMVLNCAYLTWSIWPRGQRFYFTELWRLSSNVKKWLVDGKKLNGKWDRW